MTFPLPFALLALAIFLVWCPPWQMGGRRIAPWTLAFAGAVVVGAADPLQAGPVLTWPALVALAALCASAYAALEAPRFRPAFVALTGLLALAMSLHLLPGFHNPEVLRDVQLTPDARPFGLRLNFDKGAAGLVLLAAFCTRVSSMRQFARQLPTIALAAIATSAVAIGLALATGYVHVEPKWPAAAPAFLVANLFFTCVAEEAFFRGLIQERLMRIADARQQPAWTWFAIIVSALLFGLAHAAGGWTWMFVATIAGVGYACIYAKTRTIEGAILVHFALNATHFIGFTYPALAG